MFGKHEQEQYFLYLKVHQWGLLEWSLLQEVWRGEPRFCFSNEPPVDAKAAGLATTIRGARMLNCAESG